MAIKVLLVLGLTSFWAWAEICVGLVPGVEPEAVVEAGILALELLGKASFVLGTSPLLEMPYGPTEPFISLLRDLSARPTRGRVTPALNACLDQQPKAIIFITGEAVPEGELLPLLPRLARAGTRLFVVASAPESKSFLRLAQATGGEVYSFSTLPEMAKAVVQAVSKAQNRRFLDLGSVALTPPNPLDLATEGGTLYVLAEPRVTPSLLFSGQRMAGEVVHWGSLLVHRFSIPRGKVQLLSSRYGMVWLLLTDLPTGSGGWPMAKAVLAGLGGLLALASLTWAWQKLHRPQKWPYVVITSPGKRGPRVPITSEGLVLGQTPGDMPGRFLRLDDPALPRDEPALALSFQDGQLWVKPISAKVPIKLNNVPLLGSQALADLDHLSFGGTELTVFLPRRS